MKIGQKRHCQEGYCLQKLLKDGGSECEGMFTVRHIKDDWYFEVPDSLLGRLLLLLPALKLFRKDLNA